MSTETKKNTWKLIIQLIVSIPTAMATTLGVTSCWGANVFFYKSAMGITGTGLK